MLDSAGNRLDKEVKPINLRLFMPDSDDNYPKAAQFIKEWYEQLGVKVTTQVFSSAALTEIIYPPEAGEKYTADYDIELWGWSGGVDPNGLLQIFRCEEIGTSSDSQYCNPAYDQMYADQLKATSNDARKSILTQMQNVIYDDAVYDILYYDANLEAYRTDRFAGWENQPLENGDAVLHVQHASVHEAHRCEGRADAGPVRRCAGVLTGCVAGGRRHARRERDDNANQRQRRWIFGAAPGRGRRPGRDRGHRSRVVQSATQCRRGCGRRRVIGLARFGGPPTTWTRAPRLTGVAG